MFCGFTSFQVIPTIISLIGKASFTRAFEFNSFTHVSKKCMARTWLSTLDHPLITILMYCFILTTLQTYHRNSHIYPHYYHSKLTHNSSKWFSQWTQIFWPTLEFFVISPSYLNFHFFNTVPNLLNWHREKGNEMGNL